MNLYEKWDALCAEADAFHAFARKPEQYEIFRKEAEQNACRKVLSSFPIGFGLASPSVMTKFIIKKQKNGRIIKQPKPGQPYQTIYYDAADNPVIVEDYADLHAGDDPAKSESTYFVTWHDAVWSARYAENSHRLDNIHYRSVYDEQHRLMTFCKLTAGYNSMWAEEYDYSETQKGIVTCLFTFYAGQAQGSSKNIPIGFSGAPASQWNHIVCVNEAGFLQSMDVYKNIKGEFVFQNHTDFPPSCKTNIYGKKR